MKRNKSAAAVTALAAAFLLAILALASSGCSETAMTVETQVRTTIPPEVQGDAASSSPSISADGRLIAFKSEATNLVVGSTNGARSIYIKDARTGVTTRVSTSSEGVNGNRDSDNPSISGNGRFVVFDSASTNIVQGDNNSQCVSASGTNINCPDVFIKDLDTGTTRLVSASAAGVQGNNSSQHGAISADGRFVAFSSAATNLVPGDTNAKTDVFLKDMQTGAVSLVSAGADGSQGDDDSDAPSLSADGRFVAFRSLASSLAPGDTNGKTDVFLKDTQTGALTRVSTDASGAQGDAASGYTSLAISANGRFVAFESGASNLVPDDSNGKRDVFIKDTQSGAIALVSASAAGVEGDEDSYESISVSADGRFVGFSSDASNLVAGDANQASGKTDIFLKDTQTGAIQLISSSSSGVQALGRSHMVSISGDALFAAFDSEAANLVAGDTNNKSDVFLKDTRKGVITRVSTSTADLEAGAPGADGQPQDTMGNTGTATVTP
ncbi:MAG: hypothetical protein M1539_00225 [Actinobacteria bacterium]|nr:hypothetical protein [Actinomycetota bacterium]